MVRNGNERVTSKNMPKRQNEEDFQPHDLQHNSTRNYAGHRRAGSPFEVGKSTDCYNDNLEQGRQAPVLPNMEERQPQASAFSPSP
eukprot:c30179_g1_i1 orf=240-497(+)